MRAALICLLLLMPGLVLAQTIIPRERIELPVVGLGDGQIEVIRNDSAGPAQMWCGAGLYAKNVLGQPRGRLWLARAHGPAQTAPGRRSAIFSITPITPESTSYSFSLRQVGLTKSIGAAIAACEFFETFVVIETAQGRFRR